MEEFDRISEATEFVKKRIGAVPKTGIVLGSGLGDFADELKNSVVIPYSEIPHFKKVSIKGHKGNLVKGEKNGIEIVVLQGRYHFYEGFDIKDVVFPVRTLCVLGIKNLILTNAAGGINRDFSPGDLMAITDHINLMGVNPLTGRNDERLGPRFPDMSEIYDNKIEEMIFDTAQDLGIILREGVYAGLRGPSYETPAEIRMLSTIGADAVGMSTVPESIAARHTGVKIGGISCITNLAAGISSKKLDHKEVTETALKVKSDFIRLLDAIIQNL